METYLGDMLKSTVMGNDKYIKLLIEDKEEFKDLSKKLDSTYDIKLESLYSLNDSLRGRIKEDLNVLMYHNLKLINKYYEKLFGINFGDIRFLEEAVRKRHHIVHRSGKNIQGELLIITEKDVKELLEKVHIFLYDIDTQMMQLKETKIGENFWKNNIPL